MLAAVVIALTPYLMRNAMADFGGLRGAVVNANSQPGAEALCSAHAACTSLSGFCCPTAEGVRLGCCSEAMPESPAPQPPAQQGPESPDSEHAMPEGPESPDAQQTTTDGIPEDSDAPESPDSEHPMPDGPESPDAQHAMPEGPESTGAQHAMPEGLESPDLQPEEPEGTVSPDSQPEDPDAPESPDSQPEDPEGPESPDSQAEDPEGPESPDSPEMPKAKTFDSVNPIIARGNFLYDSVTGHRFFAKGVAYNPRNEVYDHSFGNAVKVKGWVDHCKAGDAKTLGYTQDTQVDSLEEFWSADLEAIANMGANTVRLYNIDPQQSHKAFMDKAASLGLYVIVPLNGKDWGFLPAFPSPDCYTQNITGYGVTGVNALSFAKQVVKEFSQYDNTLLFTVANELPQNDKNGWAAFPCVKALTRDVHRYQRNCSENMRKVPLIYSDVDMGGETRGEIAEYLTCALESEDDAVDAYGLNVYSWCNKVYPGNGDADNFDYSPYKDIKKDFDAFPVPFLFTEFGCNLGDFKTKCPYKGGREWPEVKHFLGPDMGQFMSGAIAFQWSMDKEEYGLTLSPGFLAGQEKLELLDNYYALKKVYEKYKVNQTWDASPSKVDSCSFVPSDVAAMNHKHERPKCPAKDVWTKIQKQRGVDTISDWSIIPPPADAPLADAGNQSECPATSLSAAVQTMACFKDAA